ncbi:4777_t:CDS:1, partial [Cetraspora pellucida]
AKFRQKDQKQANFDSNGCWYPKIFKKAVIIMIDALRFDFAIPHQNKPIQNPANHYYLNKLPIFNQLLTTQPSNSLLFQYVADPPTTTLQRLKALTTGTLPTFIDAGSNFAGYAIDEDNLICQFRNLDMKIAFMGDDTWISLFPDQFDQNMSHPFPSFNVWDLHTVDNGILNLLGPTLKLGNDPDSSQWDVLIAHFLGVDHCGHRYGPDHPAMAEKLGQMDDMIRNVIRDIDDNTIVLIMGDHGMDSKGDHGGDSDEEVESTLFLYSKKRLTHDATTALSRIYQKLDAIESHGSKSFTKKFGTWRTIPQIDLVPTLSLLLGIPIPFNNLGMIIPEVFLFNSENDDLNVNKQLMNLLDVTRLNAEQVYRYTIEYSLQQPSTEFSKDAIHVLRNMFEHAETKYNLLKDSPDSSLHNDLEDAIVLYMSFLKNTLFICRRLWAQFDLYLIITGISILTLSCVCIGLHITRNTRCSIALYNQKTVMYAFVGGCLSTVFTLGFIRFISPLIIDSSFSTFDLVIFGASFGSMIGFIIHYIRSNSFPTLPKNIPFKSFDTFMSIFFLIIHSFLFASNSYTVFEDRITTFLLQTFGLFTFFEAFKIKNVKFRLKLQFFTLMYMLATRIAAYSTICREEQMPYCTSTFYISSTSTVSSPPTLIILIAMTVFMPYIICRLLKLSESYNGVAPLWIEFGLRGGLILSAAYWIMDNLDSNSASSVVAGKDETELNTTNILFNQSWKWVKNFIVRLAFGLSTIVGTVAWSTNPLCLDLKMIDIETDDTLKENYNKSDKNTHLKLKNSGRQASSSSKQKKSSEQTKRSEKAIEILGYRNAFGASYFVFLTIIYLLLFITQKPMGGIMLSIALCQLMCLLEIINIKRNAYELNIVNKFSSKENEKDVSNTSSPSNSYDLQHKPTKFLDVVILSLLSSLYFFSTGHQATLSSIQWSVGFIGIEELNYIISPLLVILNTLSSQILFSLAIPLLAFWNITPKSGYPLFQELTRSILMYIFYNGVVATSSVFWAAFFKRHLMVWKVFVPRFMLGGISLLTADLVICGLSIGFGCWKIMKEITKYFEIIYK